jgi:hypothetical protein
MRHRSHPARTAQISSDVFIQILQSSTNRPSDERGLAIVVSSCVFVEVQSVCNNILVGREILWEFLLILVRRSIFCAFLNPPLSCLGRIW